MKRSTVGLIAIVVTGTACVAVGVFVVLTLFVPTSPTSPTARSPSPALTGARQKLSESNMRQLLQLVQMYALENRDAFPDTLEQLRSVSDSLTDRDGKPQTDFNKLITNPITGHRPGYVYKKPAPRVRDVADPYHTPILWEAANGAPDPNGARGFADWQVDRKSATPR